MTELYSEGKEFYKLKKLTVQDLLDFQEIIREYLELVQKKQFYIRKISSLRSTDFTRTKVTTGNKKGLSEPEHYAVKLEGVNRKITQYKGYFVQEVPRFKYQLGLLKGHYYSEILKLRYMANKPFKVIVRELYEHKPDYDTNFDGYRDDVMRRHRSALAQINKKTPNYDEFKPKVIQKVIGEL